MDAVTDRFAGLRRIGIDEISCKKGHTYLTVVASHDSGLLVWAAQGRDAEGQGGAGKKALGRWLAWAQRCRMAAFTEFGRAIKRHRAAIDSPSVATGHPCPADKATDRTGEPVLSDPLGRVELDIEPMVTGGR